jgi:hypothetical protein
MQFSRFWLDITQQSDFIVWSIAEFIHNLLSEHTVLSFTKNILSLLVVDHYRYYSNFVTVTVQYRWRLADSNR